MADNIQSVKTQLKAWEKSFIQENGRKPIKVTHMHNLSICILF